jgi:hypothetical protein
MYCVLKLLGLKPRFVISALYVIAEIQTAVYRVQVVGLSVVCCLYCYPISVKIRVRRQMAVRILSVWFGDSVLFQEN